MMPSTAPARSRLAWFLTTTFAITWSCWWMLALLAGRGYLHFGQPLFMTLYMLGGFGPTIAALVSVRRTPATGSAAEYRERLFRARAGARWWLAALGLPFALSGAGVALASVVDPSLRGSIELAAWYMVLPYLAVMIVGGGLEELGWRGVAQPELERRMTRVAASLLIGAVWSLWHLPLFFIPGTGQFGTDFGPYAGGVLGLALILGWLYGATRSILLCVLFHAAFNAASAMGLVVPTSPTAPALADAALKVIVGLALVLTTRRTANRPAFTMPDSTR